MNTTLTIIGAVIGIALLVAIIPVVSTGIGAMIGWGAGLWFPSTAAWVTAHTGLQAYQGGALVGFVSGFFRSANTTTND
jgi:hypothetical protein